MEWKIMTSGDIARRTALETGSANDIKEATAPLPRSGDGNISTALREVDIEPDGVM
jgi:hypothetical protein